MKREPRATGYGTAVKADQQPRRGGEYDQLWMLGIACMLGFGVWSASRDRLTATAATRGLLGTDAAGHHHAAPLAWLTLALALAAVGGGAAVAGWLGAARRWKATQLGAIPRPPAVAAGLVAAGVLWVGALLFTGTDRTLFGVTGASALAGGVGVGWFAQRSGRRWLAGQLFICAAGGVLGFAEPGMARGRLSGWTGEQPGAIRASTGPGWRGGGADLAALDRAVWAAGWTGRWVWRTVPASAVVVGKRQP